MAFLDFDGEMSEPVQESDAEAVLNIMKTADRLSMPKILACYECRVAINSVKGIRTKAFWEKIPACSSARIAMGLAAAHENCKAHAISKIGAMREVICNTSSITCCHARNIMNDTLTSIESYELKVSVPPCKAFLTMAEPILDQA